MRRLLVLATALLLVGGCARSEDTLVPAPTRPAGTPLPLGKNDLPLTAGRWVSPDGFVPALSVQVGTGWTSVHRYADAFDVGRPDPQRDAPLVVVTFSVSGASSAAAAVADLATAPGATAPVADTLAGSPAQRLDVLGGSASVYRSRDGDLELDGAQGQRLRFLVADVGGVVVVAAVLVPDARAWAQRLAVAAPVLASLRTY
ncbi:MAG: hypothetical protein QOE45_665 [Frankiaceae bacterium]|nr:hypothetical protein [Frankiaceae bacterium]